jgi:hypothetical protein
MMGTETPCQLYIVLFSLSIAHLSSAYLILHQGQWRFVMSCMSRVPDYPMSLTQDLMPPGFRPTDCIISTASAAAVPYKYLHGM